MRISDWSSDVCSSDLSLLLQFGIHGQQRCGRYLNVGAEIGRRLGLLLKAFGNLSRFFEIGPQRSSGAISGHCGFAKHDVAAFAEAAASFLRSEEHTSELQSLMRISYAVFCLQKKHYNKNLYMQYSLT